MHKTAFLSLVCTAALSVQAQDDKPLLDYPCNDKAGTVLKNAVSAQPNGTLNVKSDAEVRGVSIVCKTYGEWQPILAEDGFQYKGIVVGTDSTLAEGERPIVLDRDRDYAIDCANGRIKALGGARVELGQPFSLEFRYSNPGPAWSVGHGDGGLRFDGADDVVTLGSLAGRTPTAST